MWNFGYHLARAQGDARRGIYRALLPALARTRLRPPASLPFEVFAYSGKGAFAEQVASIRSFLTHAGRPKKFTVVSDGTYSRRHSELLERLDPVVRVSPFSAWLPGNLPAAIYPYLTTHPTGKQLALIMSLPVDGPVLYADSDVRFFAAAPDLRAVAAAGGAPAFYLQDCQLSADARLLRAPDKTRTPVNTGFLLLLQALDWSLGIQRFLELAAPPNFFTNQTIAHLTMHANGARPFDPQKYVLQLDDQFLYRDHYASPALAMRHYVNPVRHKFWLAS